jgi:hypothetical protein
MRRNAPARVDVLGQRLRLVGKHSLRDEHRAAATQGEPDLRNEGHDDLTAFLDYFKPASGPVGVVQGDGEPLPSQIRCLAGGLHAMEEAEQRLDAVTTESQVDGPAELGVAVGAHAPQREVLLEEPERLLDNMLAVERRGVAVLLAVDAVSQLNHPARRIWLRSGSARLNWTLTSDHASALQRVCSITRRPCSSFQKRA